jgi:hypothetical protein
VNVNVLVPALVPVLVLAKKTVAPNVGGLIKRIKYENIIR